MRHNFHVLFVAVITVVALGGCSKAKEQLGMTRQTPDEFAVVKRAPLELPPDYTLRPPRPGADRPQEKHTSRQAEATVFGREVKPQRKIPDAGEDIILSKAGASQADPEIRELVDQETKALKREDVPVAEKLLGWGDEEQPPATVVDAKAEAKRLKKNQQEGKPITDGNTPYVEE